jgi:hypothetical protein
MGKVSSLRLDVNNFPMNIFRFSSSSLLKRVLLLFLGLGGGERLAAATNQRRVHADHQRTNGP